MALTFKDVRRLFQVPARSKVRLRDYSPGWAADKHFQDLTKDELKARAAKFLTDKVAELADAQERLYASDTHSVLIVLQASDAAGKDGTIKHVMSGEPSGVPGICVQEAFERGARSQLSLALHEGPP